MNIQQFQYILAVAEHKHFELAAQKCHITQSTLSTMISRFEDEIGFQIFDRKKKPVALSQEGALIVEQLKTITGNIEQLTELAKEIKGEVSGELSLSVIPTIAPFVLPLFLQEFATAFPNLNILVREETTFEIQRKLKSRELDIGLISTPLLDKELSETELYKEPFVYYDTSHLPEKKMSVKKIKLENLCLMEEGHCMRTQILQLCEDSIRQHLSKLNFEYKAGSIDSLLRFVKASKGATLIPYLAALDVNEKEKKYLNPFTAPVPYRTVGLIVHRHFVKKKLLKSLEQIIVKKVNEKLPKTQANALPLYPV